MRSRNVLLCSEVGDTTVGKTRLITTGTIPELNEKQGVSAFSRTALMSVVFGGKLIYHGVPAEQNLSDGSLDLMSLLLRYLRRGVVLMI